MEYDIPTRWSSSYEILTRVLYLRPAIETFLDGDRELKDLKLSPSQWKMIQFILDLLESFHRISLRLESTLRISIDKVYPVYESLFNELDRLSDILENPRHE